jgi:hypothetical protein
MVKFLSDYWTWHCVCICIFGTGSLLVSHGISCFWGFPTNPEGLRYRKHVLRLVTTDFSRRLVAELCAQLAPFARFSPQYSFSFLIAALEKRGMGVRLVPQRSARCLLSNDTTWSAPSETHLWKISINSTRGKHRKTKSTASTCDDYYPVRAHTFLNILFMYKLCYDMIVTWTFSTQL